MHNGASQMEWQVAESEDEWRRMRPARPPAERGPSRSRTARMIRCVLMGLISLLLLLGVSEGAYQQRAQRSEEQRARAELEDLFRRAVETGAYGDPALFETYVEPTMSRAWRSQLTWQWRTVTLYGGAQAAPFQVTIQAVHQVGDLAWVEAVLSVPDDASVEEAIPLRVTYFYRRTPAGWLRTAPQAALWGEPQTLETAYFRFEFREKDAAAVQQVADQIDAHYRTVRRDLGLALPVFSAAKIVLDISPETVPLPDLYRAHDRFNLNGTRIMLSSPGVHQTPAHLSDAEILAQSVSLLLIEAAVDEWSHAMLVHQGGLDWTRLVPALRLWQIWDRNEPLDAGRRELIEWLYIERPVKVREPDQWLPRSYTQMCATYAAWNLAPEILAVPITCSELDPLIWFAHGAPTHVRTMMQYQSEIEAAGDSLARRGEVLALTTVLEYVVATYGREQLPVFLDGFGRYPNWATLIPTVFGVSVDAFEAGWRAYLADEYGVVIE